MSKSKVFAGPPANKATAATLAGAAATLFWTITTHTFWTDVAPADLTTYITTSTVALTSIVAFLVPESEAYARHALGRLQTRRSTGDTRPRVDTGDAVDERLGALERGMQEISADLTRLAVHGTSTPRNSGG